MELPMNDHVFLDRSFVSKFLVLLVATWTPNPKLFSSCVSTFLVLLVATRTPNPKLLSSVLSLPLDLNTYCSGSYEGSDCKAPKRGRCHWVLGGLEGWHSKLQISRSNWCACKSSMTLIARKMHEVEKSNRDLCKHSIALCPEASLCDKSFESGYCYEVRLKLRSVVYQGDL